MITFKAIIIPNNKRKDGTYPVKIRVTFKGVSRRLPTTLVCKSTDITRGNKIKNADILSKADELIIRMRNVVRDISPFDLESRDVDWVVNRVKTTLSDDSFHLDFFEWCDSYIATKQKTTQGTYIAAVNSLERFLGKRELDINDITKSMILEFVDFVNSQPKVWHKDKYGSYTFCKTKKIPDGAAYRYVFKLQRMFNEAKDKYNDEDMNRILIAKSPFDKIKKITPPCTGQRNLGKDIMQKIISAETDDTRKRIALDIFVVSFCLMGANMADLFNAHPVKDTWIYYRQKTRDQRSDKAEMRITIPAVARPFIARLQDGTSEWWFPLLHNGTGKDRCTARTNKALQEWCDENEIPPFTFYAARHTWASLARKIGVEKATIDECLVHKGDFDLTDIYAERSWDLLQEANAKVLGIFEW